MGVVAFSLHWYLLPCISWLQGMLIVEGVCSDLHVQEAVGYDNCATGQGSMPAAASSSQTGFVANTL